MHYLLDTNTVIALMKSNANVLAQVRRVGQAALRICVPVEAGLWFGVHKGPELEKLSRAAICDFSNIAADQSPQKSLKRLLDSSV